MTQGEGGATISTPTGTIARRMRELRTARGWSAQQLADELRHVGLRWDRSIVANLENGRRAGVSVEELLALSSVLDVAPIHLLVPLEEVPYELTSQSIVGASLARDWIRGIKALPSSDPRLYYSQVPAEEFHAPRGSEGDEAQHSRAVQLHRQLLGRASDRDETPKRTTRDGD